MLNYAAPWCVFAFMVFKYAREMPREQRYENQARVIGVR